MANKSKTVKLITALLMWPIFLVTALAAEPCLNAGGKNISVEIDYGNTLPSRTVTVPQAKDRTILEILQTIAEVKTHPVGEHVFVISIDGVEGKRGDMAWYYTIDGKSADKLAYSNIASDKTANIKWIFKKDVCSKKVDG